MKMKKAQFCCECRRPLAPGERFMAHWCGLPCYGARQRFTNGTQGGGRGAPLPLPPPPAEGAPVPAPSIDRLLAPRYEVVFTWLERVGHRRKKHQATYKLQARIPRDADDEGFGLADKWVEDHKESTWKLTEVEVKAAGPQVVRVYLGGGKVAVALR